MEDRRLLLVHAHPDDETISMGATMAHYADAGVAVTLITCTLGEEGEVVVPELANLASDRDDTLGQYRIAELAAACSELGVVDHRFLGGPGRWRDSGMMGTPQNEAANCFWQADLDEATAELAAIVRELRPQVVATYDANGGYGHPDHIQAHRVTVAAVDAAADMAYRPELGPAWTVPKLYWSALPKSLLRQAVLELRAQGNDFFGDAPIDDLPMGTPDELVTTVVDAVEMLPRKIAAMHAHATQISVDGPFFALADGAPRGAFGEEYYTLARGSLGPRTAHDDTLEADLFAGL